MANSLDNEKEKSKAIKKECKSTKLLSDVVCKDAKKTVESVKKDSKLSIKDAKRVVKKRREDGLKTKEGQEYSPRCKEDGGRCESRGRY